MKIAVDRASSCPSFLPPAGVAVVCDVTSRPLRLGGGRGKGERKPGKCEPRLRNSRCRPSNRKLPPLSPPSGNHFLGLVFSAGCYITSNDY
ncbi:hypothetical protein GW7_00833 [Heterocephalus glaber]|uniref:Uncharacterized protein n=1 Tax=Heterocephalus glaber TaxID=10181 RepID=G5C015_HETGA|nr:hypothetical protein GW7_00833 [Heterocephalus glaber]